MILLDTDFASVLAKADIVELVIKLFSGKHDLYITPEVYEELRVPEKYGFTFPQNIFRNIEILTVESEEQKQYLKLLNETSVLGKGEIESIVICENRSAIFATLDNKAKELSKNKGIKLLHIHSVLKLLLKTGICSKNDLLDIIKKIEETDKRIIDLKLVFD